MKAHSIIMDDSDMPYWECETCDATSSRPGAHNPDGSMPERAGREGDSQPMPVRNEGQDIQSAVIADITARRELGIRRYGTALQPFNGRDSLQDAYEEALDLTVYLRGVLEENERYKLALLEIRTILHSRSANPDVEEPELIRILAGVAL